MVKLSASIGNVSSDTRGVIYYAEPRTEGHEYASGSLGARPSGARVKKFGHSAMTFPGQDRDEVVQFYFRQHWARLLRPCLRMFLWTALVTAAFIVVLQISLAGQEGVRHMLLLILCGFVLVSQFDFITAFYRHFLLVIVVTNRKIHRIKKTLLIINDHQSIDVASLQDVRKSQRGIVQNVLGFGTLTLEAQESVLRLHFVPTIGGTYHAILNLRNWTSGQDAVAPA